MRPPLWHPSVELSAPEQKVVKRIKKAKLFIFLREVRHELFDDEFQVELATIFKDSSTGKCPISPARLALAIILQAYTGVSDDEVIEALEMDRRCPNQVAVPFVAGKVVHFPAALCASCRLQERCTTSKTGRSISVHLDEKFLQELRQRQLTPSGRAKLRQRVKVEHSLAHIGQWQGDTARYLGLRKNLFDLRRIAVVYNLHVIARMPELILEEGA